jgi:hypothetical protein
VIRRACAPPALPALVRPGPAHRAEHIAAEYPCADILEASRREFVVHAGLATVLTEHLLEGAGFESPLVQIHSVQTKRVLQTLVEPGAIAIER